MSKTTPPRACQDRECGFCPPACPAAVADAASAATARRAGKLLRVFAQHLLDGPDPSRQAEALK